MTTARFVAVASVIGVVCVFPQLAQAQATRTWVSGVGDDANPCSRTAPCKTFAGAISKTATGGVINALDPGGFGAVTITKSLTIDGAATMAGILGAGTNGIVVAAAAGSVVILRNIDFNGFGTGIAGVSISAAGDVRVENCKIYGFNRGIDDHRTAGHLFVSNTVVSNNVATGIVAMGGAGMLMVHLDRVQMHSNGNAGLAITGGTRATAAHSWASSNVHGFYADTGGIMTLEDSIATGNVTTGLNSQSGANIFLFNSTVTNNGNGLSTSGGSIISYGLNRIFNNTIGNGPPTSTFAPQ